MGDFFERLLGFSKFIFPLIWSVLLLGIGGIVGNRADSAFLGVLPYLSDITVNLWVLLLACGITLVPAIWVAARYYRSQQVAIKLIRLDDTLFRLLSTINLNSDPDQSTKRLIEEFLEDTLELFADGCRIHILRPDPKDKDYLTVWHSRGIPSETINRTRFCIGSLLPNQKPGIAGKSYRENKIQVVKTRFEKGKLVPSSNDYISFLDNRKRIPYRSFAAIPIPNGEKPLGVFCIDSRAPDTFDPKPVQDLLGNLADRLASTILILEKQSSSPLPDSNNP